MPNLFDPFTLRGVTLRNRIGVSPMCQYSSVDGKFSDWHLVHLGSRAVGGAGLVIAEATAVEARGRISPGDAGLWSDEHVDGLRRAMQFVKQHGAVPGLQIAHAGRKASAARPWEDRGRHLANSEGGWDFIAPSAIAFGGNLDRTPNEMTLADIATVRRAFVEATRRALAAGVEWLEFHSAHGYLSHSFLSPLSNHRTDAYGGAIENRMRFTIETAAAMREAWPERFPLSVRLSCVDWAEGGWTIEDSVLLARRLKEVGVDLIDCSSGFNTADIKQIPFAPGFQVPFAQRIRTDAGIATAAVGMITEPQQADAIIQNGQADIVLLARAMLNDAYWPAHAAQALGRRPKDWMPVATGFWLK